MADIAKYKSDDPNNSIRNWMRNRETIEFLGIWERFNTSIESALWRCNNPLIQPKLIEEAERRGCI